MPSGDDLVWITNTALGSAPTQVTYDTFVIVWQPRGFVITTGPSGGSGGSGGVGKLGVYRMGTLVASEAGVNLIPGGGVTITATDDTDHGRVDLTIAAPSAGAPLGTGTPAPLGTTAGPGIGTNAAPDTHAHDLGPVPTLTQVQAVQVWPWDILIPASPADNVASPGLRVPYPTTIGQLVAISDTAATGAGCTLRMRRERAGVSSIIGTVTIAAGQTTSPVVTSLTNAAQATGDVLKIDVTAVGGLAGQVVSVQAVGA